MSSLSPLFQATTTCWRARRPPAKPLSGLLLATALNHAMLHFFIAYTCFGHFAAMVGAPFITLYLLAHVRMGLFHVVTSVFALRIHEPQSRGTHEVVTLLVGATPLRMIRFPIGLYRTFRNGGGRTDFQPVQDAAQKAASLSIESSNRPNTPDVLIRHPNRPSAPAYRFREPTRLEVLNDLATCD